MQNIPRPICDDESFLNQPLCPYAANG
uniref:Uncharacterized protein n=1 Tax=Anguilla anguilla TaxID=7936 RepID=A0A0E9UTG7_ANGAN